ncbi:MAG: hypothetical protein OEW00_12865 [candidate division Zixibacteria bacterium]|nr:hypothetical protein [candidate division Zixibacteria bacterium]
MTRYGRIYSKYGVSQMTLKKRQIVLRRAVINGSGATDFCARFLTGDGKPLKGFTVSMDDARK